MSFKSIILLCSLSGFLAVAIGAFGAHALKEVLIEYGKDIFSTASQYHFVHTLALLGLAALSYEFPDKALLGWSAISFALGILIFSFSLYALAITGIKWLGAITPIGGLFLLGGWLLMGWAFIKG